jgi:outer membrane protein assembly factor BamD (BamD/ComL family)
VGEIDLKESEIQPENRLSGVIEEANQLARKQAFTEAKLLLIKARIKTDDESEIQIIDQALRNIEGTQNRIEQSEGPVNFVSEKEVRQHATALIEEEQYERAITVIEKHEKQQPDLDEATKRLKDLAIEKIINRDRNRAARLYLQAKNTQDSAQKKELLQASLNILKNLVEKYPSSYLIQRINDHITTVENSLNEW